MKKHRRVHTNQRPFTCPVAGCGKTFINSHHLKSHNKSHKDKAVTEDLQGTGLRLNTAVWSEGEVEGDGGAETSLETSWLEDVEMAIAKVGSLFWISYSSRAYITYGYNSFSFLNILRYLPQKRLTFHKN